MARAIESERLFFRAGPLIIGVWAFLIFQGYKALWLSVMGPTSPALTTPMATASVIALYGLARYFELLFSESIATRSWIRAIVAGFIGLLLVALSGLGVANALYATVAGGFVLESGVEKVSKRYETFVEETHILSRTPVLDDVNRRLKGPMANLTAEIMSPTCGIGSGAERVLATIQRELGPTFVPLHLTHQPPPCSDTPALQRMATQYQEHIRHQIDALPSVAKEHSAERIGLAELIDQRHELFAKQRAEALISANDAARAVQFFGSRDGFNEPIRRLILLDQTFLKDRADAEEKARQFGESYSSAILQPIEIEQEETLGSFQSLFLAISRFNPWYMFLLVIVAIGLDVLLIVWFRHARNNAFDGRSSPLIGAAGDRVRNLWLPPEDKRRVR